MARWLHLFLCSCKCQLNKQHVQNTGLSAWLLWVKLRQTERPKGDLQITIPLCKPPTTELHFCVPSLITVDLACMYFWTFSALLSCAPFTRIIAITYAQCGSWEVPWKCLRHILNIWTHLTMLKEALENPFFHLPSYLLSDL